MMKPLRDLFQFRKDTLVNATRFTLLFSLLFSIASSVSAQSVSWSDSFKKGEKPTTQQCENWKSFLSQLGGKSFSSVTISGTFDQTGKSINDPVAANALAALLASGTPGTVESGDHYWTVTTCQIGLCGGMSIALSVDGTRSQCECTDRYALRPQSTTRDWGGVNVASSCNAASQTMNLEFSSGISISGSTVLCEGGSTTLTATSEKCTPVNYLWSNAATTPSITVSQPGIYSVTITGTNGCTVTETITVLQTDITVHAGEDATYCREDGPVQLSPTGNSISGAGTSVNEVCIFNSPGGVGVDDCSFTTTVCLEGSTEITGETYSTMVSFSNPVELRYHVYYSAYADHSVFRFKLNDVVLDSYEETHPTGLCDTRTENKFPRSFTFNEGQIKGAWIKGGNNELSVQIESSGRGISLAGIIAEVVTTNETYTWSPVAGLSNPSIKSPLASPSVSTVYTVTYTDANNCVATDQVEVKVDCGIVNPVAVCKALTVELENNCEAEVEASAFDGGSVNSSGGDLIFSVSPAGPYPVGETEVVLTVTDSNGGSSSCTTKITVTDTVLPVIAALEDVVSGNDEGTCSATVSLVAPEVSDNCSVESITHDQADDIFPVGETTVTWTAKDIHGNIQTATQKVVVTNDDPVINSVTASTSSVAIGSPVTLTIRYTDDNISKGTVDWGDLSDPQIVDSPVETFEVSHVYSSAGGYTVTISMTDLCDAVTTYVYESITVVNGGGSVRGDGWFYSRAGFYLKNKRESGKAQFHFDAKNKKGGAQPVGSVSFKFKEGNLEFKSTQLGTLRVDDDRATLTATGKVKGSRGYSILISAVDEDHKDHDHWNDKKGHDNWSGRNGHDDRGSSKDKGHKQDDQIRVRIWDPSGNVIYDTQRGDPDEAVATTDIDGGSIEVWNNDSFGDRLEDIIDSYFSDEKTSAYPNPFTDWLNVQFNSTSRGDVVIQLMDLTGKVVVSSTYQVSDDGHYSLDIPDRLRQGIYILTIRQGKRIEFLMVVRK